MHPAAMGGARTRARARRACARARGRGEVLHHQSLFRAVAQITRPTIHRNARWKETTACGRGAGIARPGRAGVGEQPRVWALREGR